jgi:hypothetical protein
MPPAQATTTPAPAPASPAIAVARIGAVTGKPETVSDWVKVHFNPASLQLQVSNELKDTKNNERKQYVAKSNAKLTMELQFDTTDSGNDVTETTRKLQAFVAPPLPAGDQARQKLPPPAVIFEWGRIRFKGIVESYKETIDFFSASGVPLRASVALTLSRQDQVFDESAGGGRQNVGGRDNARALNTPPGSAADAANAGQSPWAARSVAADNGQESLRFGDGSALTLSAEITLKPPAAFASAGAGLGVGAGLGLDAGLGVGAGIAGAAGGVTAGVSGLSRLSATEGAFAALRVATTGPSTARLNTSRLMPQAGSASLSTDRHARFQVGGRATAGGAAGLNADVGARADLKGRLTFETE